VPVNLVKLDKKPHLRQNPARDSPGARPQPAAGTRGGPRRPARRRFPRMDPRRTPANPPGGRHLLSHLLSHQRCPAHWGRTPYKPGHRLPGRRGGGGGRMALLGARALGSADRL